MKARVFVLTTAFWILLIGSAASQSVLQKDIQSGYFNFRPLNMEWATIDTLLLPNHPAGKALVRFDGFCQADTGDRIGLAIGLNSETTDSDFAEVEVYSTISPGNHKSFSQTRIYNLPAGADTFYAKGLNIVRKHSSGYAYIYGSLTIEFFPASGSATAFGSMIDYTGNVTGGNHVIKKMAVPEHADGMVMIHVDGNISSDPGDRIVLTASNYPSWLVGSGSVVLKAFNANKRINQFSHSRVRDIYQGDEDTIYAVSSNVVDVSGSGNVHVYDANLSGEFFPTSGTASIDYLEIGTPTINLRGEPVALDSISVNPTAAGKILVQFDGYVTSSDSDLIVLAASDQPDWDVNCDNVSVGYTTGATNQFSEFSHSRLYNVAPGKHTFYAIAENYSVENGTGMGTITGNLIVKFFPDINSAVHEVEAAQTFTVYPNPASDQLTIAYNRSSAQVRQIVITDLSGSVVLNEIAAGSTTTVQLDISKLPKGVYLVRSSDMIKKIVKL